MEITFASDPIDKTKKATLTSDKLIKMAFKIIEGSSGAAFSIPPELL